MAYSIGLDIGSTYTKGLILDSDKNIVGRRNGNGSPSMTGRLIRVAFGNFTHEISTLSFLPGKRS